jgi:serine/threonine protein kinase
MRRGVCHRPDFVERVAVKSCPSCHRDFADDLEFCPSDGTRLAAPAGEVDPQLKFAFAGRFRILRQLGAGGMGRVFLAEQVGVGNRLVALKVLSRNPLDSSDFLERFHNEAASAGRIDNLNVVTIYESGQVSDSIPYIAMQYLEGETLRQSLKERGALPVAECNEILQQIAHGLHAAHRLGIIHRDLKPDNIFLTIRDEDRLVVKVVDFGIAKLRESGTHTITGTVLGTPAYMSYEQACGMRSDELDARSDIYSLGVVAYEMLTGRLPFQSDTPVGYLKKHLQEAPPPFRFVKSDFPAIPEVERVVIKALTKDRDHRYKTVLEFASDFSRAASVPALPIQMQTTVKVFEPLEERNATKPETVVPSQFPPARHFEPDPPLIPALPTEQKRKSIRPAMGILVTVVLIAIVAALGWHYRPTPSSPTKPDPVPAPINNLGVIEVQTSPGAEVLLDNKMMWSTDSAGHLRMFNVLLGNHTLHISLAGKKDYDNSFTVAAGQTININAPLEDAPIPPTTVPTAKTTVVVETTPRAQVYWDNHLLGWANDEGLMTIDNSSPGNHSLMISTKGMKVYDHQIEVRANQKNVVAAPLTPDQPSAPGASKRLTEREILELLRGGVPADEVEKSADQNGMAFQMTSQVEKDLRNAGATDALIEKLRKIEQFQKWHDYIGGN